MFPAVDPDVAYLKQFNTVIYFLHADTRDKEFQERFAAEQKMWEGDESNLKPI